MCQHLDQGLHRNLTTILWRQALFEDRFSFLDGEIDAGRDSVYQGHIVRK